MLKTKRQLGIALQEHRDRWQQMAWSTAPADRKQIETDVGNFYRNGLQRDPPKCAWVENPLKAHRRLRLDSDYDTSGVVRAKLHAALSAINEHKRFRQIRETLWPIRRPWADDWGNMWRYREQPMAGYTDEEVSQCALVDFFATNFGADFCSRCLATVESLKPWLSVIASCNGLWFTKQGELFLMDTPEIVRTDDQGRLHCDDGPAFRFRGGPEYYYLHGIRVPKEYALTEAGKITITEVLEQRNAEVRLTLISKIGFQQLFGAVRHWTISEANGNALLEFRVKGTQLVRVLRLKWRDKTGDKETIIPVPSRRSYFGDDCPDDIDDCEQVRRWTLGWPKEAMVMAES